MDDVCVYSSALTLEQLTENVEGCKQHSSLVLSLLFDQDSTSTSPPSNYDDVSDAKVGYAVDHTSDGLLLGFGSNDVVKHAPSYPSAAPASSTTSSIVCESTASTCDLTAHILAACGTCTSITVPASPSFGSITVVDGSSPPASSTYVLTLTSSSPVTAAPSHVLSYTLTYGDASTAARTLHVLPNAAPKAHGVEGVEAAELVSKYKHRRKYCRQNQKVADVYTFSKRSPYTRSLPSLLTLFTTGAARVGKRHQDGGLPGLRPGVSNCHVPNKGETRV